jgi:hypothetical protein
MPESDSTLPRYRIIVFGKDIDRFKQLIGEHAIQSAAAGLGA